MSFFVNEIYSVVAMGRSINFGKNNVGGLPIPLVADEIQYEIGQLAERLQTLASDAADVNGSEYQTCLNRLNILVDDVFGMDG